MTLELPVGTITFLFSDLEGSTRLWEQEPEIAREVLARHDAIIEAEVAHHHGVIVRPRGEGDSRFAVFRRASEAVKAAAAIQGAMHNEVWPQNRHLRVRVALHTGEAQVRAGDYYGSAVNRCARLRSLAHGGQTLLSQTTYNLARDSAFPEITFRDLGEHRLKDLIEPERVYQLVTQVPSDFPRLQSLDAHLHNLPTQLTSFIGREQEVQSLCVLLRRPDLRLVTLTGPGGAGKSRLSLQVAAELLGEFEDGAFFVALASLHDAELFAPAVAQALGLSDTATPSFLTSLKEHLRAKRVLLVLDNFEQIVAAAPTVTELLQACAGLKIIATSRVPLHVSGEQEFPVRPLPLPQKHPTSIEAVSQYAAVQLFIERARAVKPDFAVTNENAPAVASICARLDGLPLAIELAAVRVKILSPQAILARLEGVSQTSLQLLTGGTRDLTARQQTLRNTIAWSYDLLSEEEKTVFRRLAVFSGGCTLEAVEDVCGADSQDSLHSVFEVFYSLLDKNLVQQTGSESEPRFTLLATIKEYAWERCRETEDVAPLRGRHLAFCVAQMERCHAAMLSDVKERLALLKEAEKEQDNVRAALEWGESNALESALRLIVAWDAGHVRERGACAQRVLEKITRDENETFSETHRDAMSELLGLAADYAAWQGDFARQKRLAEQRLSLMRARGEAAHVAWALHTLGLNAAVLNDQESAIAYLTESLSIFRELQGSEPVAWVSVALGGALADKNDNAAARDCYEEARVIFQQSDDLDGVAGVCAELGDLARREGDLPNARALFENVANIERQLQDTRNHPWRRYELGCLEMLEGDYAAAGTRLRAALRTLSGTYSQPSVMQRGILYSLAALGCLAGLQTQWTRMVRLLSAEKTHRESLHLPPSPTWEHDLARSIAAGQAAMGDAAFTAAWAQGEAMTIEQAIAYALEDAES